MEIYINLTQLGKLGLNPSLYTYLYCLYFEKPYDLADDSVKEYMNIFLQKLGYLKITTEGIVLREDCGKLFQKGTPTDESVSSWIEEWRDLFPKGVKSGNRPVRGEKQGVIKKMKTFVKAHPKVTKDQIMEATKGYVFDSSLKSYQFMICADYFISKNGSSVLAATIEDIEDRGSTLSRNEDGGGSWHREI